MGMMTAISLGLGLATAGMSIAQGHKAKEEAGRQAQAYEMEAKGYEEQADLLNAEIDALEQNKILEGSRYARQRRRYAGTIVARTAKSGFKLSGSPLVVLMDGLTQLNLDESIGRFNIEMEQYNVRGEQRQIRAGAGVSRRRAISAKESGKTSLLGGYVGGFSTLLRTGALLKS